MQTRNSEGYYKEMADNVQEKLNALAAGSHVKAHLSAKLPQIETNLKEELKNGATFPFLPPLFLFVVSHSLEQLQRFDQDIQLVLEKMETQNREHYIEFLQANNHEDRSWAAGVFETFVKSAFLRSLPDITKLDYSLPNNRNADVCLCFPDAKLFLECTVLTDSDTTRQTWNTYWEEQLDGQDILLTTGNPAHGSCRVYAKVYDKLAYKFDPGRSQLEDSHPNLLLISFDTVKGPPSHDDPCVEQAIEELFSNASITDSSFHRWFEFNRNQFIWEGKGEIFNRNRAALKDARKKISAIVLFEGCEFKSLNVNPNAVRKCALDEAKTSSILEVLRNRPAWA